MVSETRCDGNVCTMVPSPPTKKAHKNKAPIASNKTTRDDCAEDQWQGKGPARSFVERVQIKASLPRGGFSFRRLSKHEQKYEVFSCFFFIEWYALCVPFPPLLGQFQKPGTAVSAGSTLSGGGNDAKKTNQAGGGSKYLAGTQGPRGRRRAPGPPRRRAGCW